MNQKMDDSYPFDAAWIAGILGLETLPLDHSTRLSRFTTDSRRIPQAGLFVAIRGEKMDGHDFISAAISAGAHGVLAEKSVIETQNLKSKFPKVRFFEVQNVQDSFRKIAAAWRSRFNIPVVMVAGSNGKTTTKELLGAILQGRYPSVLKTSGSQNGFLGIPLTLIELRSTHGAAVIEVGIDEVGAMAQHVPIVRPTHTVLTIIGPEHLEKLIDLPTVAREENLAFHFTHQQGGKCIVNLDDPWISSELPKLPGCWSFSIDGKIAPQATTILGHYAVEGAQGVLETSLEGKSLKLDVPLPGRHNAQNLQAAVTTAACIGLSTVEIQKGLATFQGAEGRSQIRDLPTSQGTRVICDYYNASPVSMAAAFTLLAQTGSPHARRIACLADMKELGTDELRFHAELAPALIQSGVSAIFLHGPRMKALEDALKKASFCGSLKHYDELQSLVRDARETITPGSIVLIKGSRSMKMETVWQELQKA